MYNSRRDSLSIEDNENYRKIAFRSCNHVPSWYVSALIIELISRLKGHQGTDLMLMETMHDVLKSAGRPTVIRTGKAMFERHEM